MRDIKIFALFISVILIFCTGKAWAAPFYEQYYQTKIKESQIGYSFVSQEEQEDADKKIIVTNKHYELKFKRLGFDVKILQDIQFIEDMKGDPISFAANMESKGETINIKGRFLSPKRLHVTSIINGNTKSEEIEIKKEILFPYAINQLFQNNEKETLEYSTIDPTNDIKIVTVTAQKVGAEVLKEGNIQGEYTKYKVSIDLLPNIDSYEWYDKQGRSVKEKSSLLGLEKIASNKDQIVGNVDSYDIFYKSLIPVKTHIPDPFNLDSITYKIETQSENPEEIFITDDKQRIIHTRENTIYLKIKNQLIDSENFKYPVEASDFSDYLKSGPYITSDNPEIINQANMIIGHKKDAYKIAKTMEKWVFDEINTKDLSVNFANAAEVMKTKEGDCTEHSVLLASLLRAAGIPSKVVVGLMYTNVPEEAFVYHMWVNAYIGKWISLDPSFPNDSFSPIHIAISEYDLNNLSSKTDIVLDVIKSFTTLKISILNYSTIANNIIGVKLSESNNPLDIKIKLKDNNNNPETPIKNISLKTGEDIPSLGSEQRKKYIEESTRSGFYNFSKGNINQAKYDFEKVAKLIPYNDDFSDVKLALKLASLGLFNLADNQLKNVHDGQIWDLQIKDLKSIYYPKNIPSSEDEMLLAQALSKINFQNDPFGAISLINNEAGFDKYDYTHYLTAKAYLARNESDKALKELEKAIDNNPDNLSYKLELAKIYSKKNEFKKAKKELDYILKQNLVDKKFIELVNTELYWLLFKDNRKDNTKSQYYLARYYGQKGEYKAAIDILNKLINNKQEESYIYELLGDYYFHLNQLNDARLSYQTALKLNKKSSKSLVGLGNILKKEGKYKGSLNEYLKAEKFDPEYPDLILSIANAYKLLSQEEIAYKYFDKLLNFDNNNYFANYNIGLMHLNSGKADKAEEYFKKALSVNPNYSDSWLQLAKVEIDKKNYFLAKTYLDAVSYLDQDNSSQYYYYLGLINKNNEDYSVARLNFKKAIELKADHREALEELKKLK
ncbi:MAG: hypothetical protein A2104_06890 [Candidatus Melainabacteria bacterium GWF2_32_7]|nr:MAG: hypothetical protein A2104_06890 [Candidatus Melainabacteria bacterium GWF2_32_7]